MMKKLANWPVAMASLMSLGAAAQAQTTGSNGGSDVLEEVLVTAANRTGKALDRIPGAVNVISTEDVANNIAVTEDVGIHGGGAGH